MSKLKGNVAMLQAILVVTTLCAIASESLADPLLVEVDQSVVSSIDDVISGDRSGQTFTALSARPIAGVELFVQAGSWGSSYPGGSDTIVRLRALGNSGVPLVTPLAVGHISRTQVSTAGDWVRVLFGNPVQQAQGSRYSIMTEDLTGGAQGWNNYGRGTANPYLEGQQFFLDYTDPFNTPSLQPSSSDLAFRTLVIVPEPLLIGPVGLTTLLGRRR